MSPPTPLDPRTSPIFKAKVVHALQIMWRSTEQISQEASLRFDEACDSIPVSADPLADMSQLSEAFYATLQYLHDGYKACIDQYYQTLTQAYDDWLDESLPLTEANHGLRMVSRRKFQQDQDCTLKEDMDGLILTYSATAAQFEDLCAQVRLANRSSRILSGEDFRRMIQQRGII